jgi:23S rRNA pseudouridine2605 synthase
MRINKFVAASTGISRRAADTLIASGRVLINGHEPAFGETVQPNDNITLDGQTLQPLQTQTILFHKPVGYVTSRDGQGAATIYDLLPKELHHLKPVGRLDKESSGLLLLTNDGDLAQSLTHPSYHKTKIYQIELDKPLAPLHRQMISDMGIQLEDGPSKLQLDRLQEGSDTGWQVTMREGRNRQIRRTFAALGYDVAKLHRTHLGPYAIDTLPSGSYITKK